jgi:sirohydrochlorin ferrochelatase
MTALLLIAHGSRRAEANADLDWLADTLRARQRFDVIATSYLELVEPTIAAAGDACAAAGATTVIMLPYFLAPGIHVTEDLIEAQAALASKYPAIAFRLAAPLGRHPKLAEIALERAVTA